MGLRSIHLIGLIAGAMIMWDQSLLVETASDQADRKASEVPRSRLPPDIAIPLPYIYPEYVDPREQTTTSRSTTTEENRVEQTTSVSDIILENVRQTMLLSTPMEEIVPVVHKNNAIKSTIHVRRRPVTSTMRTMISDDNNDEPIVMQTINDKPVEEMKRPFGRRPIRFGTRLRIRTSTAHSIQNFTKITATPMTMTTPISTTPIPACVNDANDTATASLNNNLPNCHQPSPTKTSSVNSPIDSTRNSDNVILRRRPGYRMRQVAVRRVRPTAENARNTNRVVRRMRIKKPQSDAGMEEEKPEIKRRQKRVCENDK